MRFEDAAWDVLNEREIDKCPLDLQVILLMEAFPGHTREQILAYPSHFVERMRTWLLLRARKQKQDRR